MKPNPPNHRFDMNRRQFLQTTGLLAAGPLVAPHDLLGADAPSRQIGIGMIGMGRQAYEANLEPFLKSPDCVVTAICDVDAWRLEQGLQAVEKHYRKKVAKGYRDFRKLLADPNVDAGTCHLAHIAIQLGGVKLAWDPEQETFPGNEAANNLLNRPPLRAP